jgi:hypothetical protein
MVVRKTEPVIVRTASVNPWGLLRKELLRRELLRRRF